MNDDMMKKCKRWEGNRRKDISATRAGVGVDLNRTPVFASFI
jgi:hypothetical protein